MDLWTQKGKLGAGQARAKLGAIFGQLLSLASRGGSFGQPRGLYLGSLGATVGHPLCLANQSGYIWAAHEALSGQFLNLILATIFFKRYPYTAK